MKRKIAREEVFKLLFEADLSDKKPNEVLKSFIARETEEKQEKIADLQKEMELLKEKKVIETEKLAKLNKEVEEYTHKLDKFNKAIKFINDYVLEISEKLEDINEIIERNLKAWKLDRIGSVERSLLRISVYEIIFKDLAFEISINEAVELSKKYGEEKSYEFINGVLANVVKEKTKG